MLSPPLKSARAKLPNSNDTRSHEKNVRSLARKTCSARISVSVLRIKQPFPVAAAPLALLWSSVDRHCPSMMSRVSSMERRRELLRRTMVYQP